MKPTLLLLPFLLASPVFCADATLVVLLPSDTQVVLGIHVRALVDSELGRNLTTELKGQAADWQKLIAASGFDPLHDLDEVLIASTGAGKNAPTLVVARGTFDVAKLAANAEQYNGVPLVAGKSSPAQGVFGFLDGSTAGRHCTARHWPPASRHRMCRERPPGSGRSCRRPWKQSRPHRDHGAGRSRRLR